MSPELSREDSGERKGGEEGCTYEVKGVLSGGLLPEERNGPRVVHDGVRVQRDGVRELLGGVEEGLEEGDGLFARGGKRVQARGGDVVGNGSRLCLQCGQHRRWYVGWVFCHDNTMVVGDGERVSAPAPAAKASETRNTPSPYIYTPHHYHSARFSATIWAMKETDASSSQD